MKENLKSSKMAYKFLDEMQLQTNERQIIEISIGKSDNLIEVGKVRIESDSAELNKKIVSAIKRVLKSA